MAFQEHSKKKSPLWILLLEVYWGILLKNMKQFSIEKSSQISSKVPLQLNVGIKCQSLWQTSCLWINFFVHTLYATHSFTKKTWEVVLKYFVLQTATNMDYHFFPHSLYYFSWWVSQQPASYHSLVVLLTACSQSPVFCLNP